MYLGYIFGLLDFKLTCMECVNIVKPACLHVKCITSLYCRKNPQKVHSNILSFSECIRTIDRTRLDFIRAHWAFGNIFGISKSPIGCCGWPQKQAVVPNQCLVFIYSRHWPETPIEKCSQAISCVSWDTQPIACERFRLCILRHTAAATLWLPVSTIITTSRVLTYMLPIFKSL